MLCPSECHTSDRHNIDASRKIIARVGSRESDDIHTATVLSSTAVAW